MARVQMVLREDPPSPRLQDLSIAEHNHENEKFKKIIDSEKVPKQPKPESPPEISAESRVSRGHPDLSAQVQHPQHSWSASPISTNAWGDEQ